MTSPVFAVTLSTLHLCLALTSGPVAAQSSLPASARAELIAACASAISTGNTSAADTAAKSIMQFRYVFDTKQIAASLDCLNAVTGQAWIYSSSEAAFLTVEDNQARASAREAEARARELAASERALEEARQQAALRIEQEAEAAALRAERDAEATAIRAAREAERERRADILLRTYLACQTLLAKDEVAALTNPVCHPLFLELGLGD
ncbi:MAG: hypothetical protein KF887_06910 [Paracoccaceae bacterium]|nr:MAG: hypothetical protein KF887_06910 [Paracoccaceae bacterium]